MCVFAVGFSALTALDLIVDIYAKVPSLPRTPSHHRHTHTQGSSCVSDVLMHCLCSRPTQLWENYLCGKCDAVLEVIRDMYARNKISRSLVEARLKLIVDFFVAVQADQCYHSDLLAAAEMRRFLKEASSSDSAPVPWSRHTSRQASPRRRETDVSSLSRPRTQDTKPLSSTRPYRPPVPSLVLAEYDVANTHLYLFGKVIGVQPRIVEMQKPAVAYIVVILMVLALCDK